MPITILDAVLIIFTLVSAILAMIRGFSREVLSIASWVAAGAAAFFFYPLLLPTLKPYISDEKLATIAAAGLVFLVALIVVTIITMKIADFIIDSRVGPLDRTLGFLYGIARGVLVVSVALLFFNWLVGGNPPEQVTQSKSLPLLENVGKRIQDFMPDDSIYDMFKEDKTSSDQET